MLTLSKKTTGDAPLTGKTSIIGAGMTITGTITTEGDIRIDGKLIGTIKGAAKVVIGEDGLVDGDIAAQQADITGHAKGNITVKDLLTLRASAMVEGDIIAGKISIEPTVQFNGKISMQGASVVEMNAANDERKKAAE